MLKKRTRSVQKNHMDHETLSDANLEWGYKTKGNSSFDASRILIGFNPKGLSDSDYSVWSPTSSLDFRVLSNLGNTLRTLTPLPLDGYQKSWNSSKVGLGIVDSLEDFSKFPGEVLRPSESKNIIFSSSVSESKNIIFSSSVRTQNPNCHHSRPCSFVAAKSSALKMQFFPRLENKNPFLTGDSDVLFEIGETHVQSKSFGEVRSPSLDSGEPMPVMSGLVPAYTNLNSEDFGSKDLTTHVCSPPHFIGGSPNSNNFPSAKLNPNLVSVGSANGFTASLSASEIVLSEDYSCVITHGSDSKTTQIYGDCDFGCNSNHLIPNSQAMQEQKIVGLASTSSSEASPMFATADFLSFCYHCNKKLEDGKDIYMYRGEKAFCSSSCRDLEIMIDEQLERDDLSSESSKDPEYGGNLFVTGIPVAT